MESLQLQFSWQQTTMFNTTPSAQGQTKPTTLT